MEMPDLKKDFAQDKLASENFGDFAEKEPGGHIRRPSVHRRVRSRLSVADLFSPSKNSYNSPPQELNAIVEKAITVSADGRRMSFGGVQSTAHLENVDDRDPYKDPNKTAGNYQASSQAGIAGLFDPSMKRDKKPPTYDDIDGLFEVAPDPTMRRNYNFSGIAEFFEFGFSVDPTKGEEWGAVPLEPKQAHNRRVSYGGVMGAPEVEELDLGKRLESNMAVRDAMGHGRRVSYGGVMGAPVDADFDDPADVSGHARRVSYGGVGGPIEDEVREPQMGHAHGRRISYGGVREVNRGAAGPEIMQPPQHPGQAHGRRISYGGVREVGGGVDVGSALEEYRNGGDGSSDSRRNLLSCVKDLTESNRQLGDDLERELLFMRLSKIELIQQTSQEIDRLRQVVAFLNTQLRSVKDQLAKQEAISMGSSLASYIPWR